MVIWCCTSILLNHMQIMQYVQIEREPVEEAGSTEIVQNMTIMYLTEMYITAPMREHTLQCEGFDVLVQARIYLYL